MSFIEQQVPVFSGEEGFSKRDEDKPHWGNT